MPLIPAFDAILFDFDGVLADTEPVHWACWAEVLKPLGAVLTWEYYRDNCIGIDDRDMLRKMAACTEPPADWEAMWAQYPKKKELFRARMLHAPPFDAALDGLLASLHGSCKLAVVSSSSRTEIDPLLIAGRLRGHFDALVCSEDLPRDRLKPAPDPYLLAARLTGADRPLVLEDSAAGVASGRAAGFEVVAVTSAAEVPPFLARLLSSGVSPRSSPA
jgi:HAD superfamily hydrolase (TIGR01509 family)